jgi:predicted secreted protein
MSCKKYDHYDYEVVINSTFQVDLKSNPSTGYCWKWTNKESVTIVDTIDYIFTANYPDRPGSSGFEKWTFKAKKRGIDAIEFEYNQSWVQNSTVDRKIIIIKVK